jgi:hypothetical protein
VRDTDTAFEVVLGVTFEEKAKECVVGRVGDATANTVPLDDAAADVPDGFFGGVVVAPMLMPLGTSGLRSVRRCLGDDRP